MTTHTAVASTMLVGEVGGVVQYQFYYHHHQICLLLGLRLLRHRLQNMITMRRHWMKNDKNFMIRIVNFYWKLNDKSPECPIHHHRLHCCGQRHQRQQLHRGKRRIWWCEVFWSVTPCSLTAYTLSCLLLFVYLFFQSINEFKFS